MKALGFALLLAAALPMLPAWAAPAPVRPLPVPPVPPDEPPLYRPAPMPNADIFAPLPALQQGAHVEAKLYHTHRQFRGDGFSPYSSAQEEQERNFRPTPGLALSVPLQ